MKDLCDFIKIYIRGDSWRTGEERELRVIMDKGDDEIRADHFHMSDMDYVLGSAWRWDGNKGMMERLDSESEWKLLKSCQTFVWKGAFWLWYCNRYEKMDIAYLYILDTFNGIFSDKDVRCIGDVDGYEKGVEYRCKSVQMLTGLCFVEDMYGVCRVCKMSDFQFVR